MPIYEYRCEECHIQFEQMHRITDESLPDCPACGSAQVSKLISLSSFHLKGSGWYVTDYGGQKTDAAEAGEGGNGNGSKDEPSPEAGEKKSADSPTDAKDKKPSAPTVKEQTPGASQPGPPAS